MNAEKSNKKWRVTVGITLEREVLEIIKEKAKQSDRSVSRYVNWVLREHLRCEKELLQLGEKI